MANQEQFQAALARIETATTTAGTAITAIGARITALEDAIKNAGLTLDRIVGMEQRFPAFNSLTHDRDFLRGSAGVLGRRRRQWKVVRFSVMQSVSFQAFQVGLPLLLSHRLN